MPIKSNAASAKGFAPLSRAQAEQIGTDLVAMQPRFRDSAMMRLGPALEKWTRSPAAWSPMFRCCGGHGFHLIGCTC